MSTHEKPIQDPEPSVGRRDFLKGATGGAAALLATPAGQTALVKGAAGSAAVLLASSAGVARANGVSVHTLTVEEVPWDVGDGVTVPAYAYGLDGGPPTLPGPTIRAREGELLQITVENYLSVPTTVHFHGVFSMPHDMDGVPDVSQPPIPPGGSFTHIFQAPPPGTYEYHSHVDVFEQIARGLYGLLVVEDRVSGRRSALPSGQRGGKRRYDREYPLVLGSYPTPLGPHDDIQLINGKTFYGLGAVADPETQGKLVFPMNRGERVLFRIANFSNHVHPMHTHGMFYEVVAADGFDMQVPVRRDNLSVNAGERYDIICHADNPGAWLFHCHNLEHVVEGMIAVNVVS